MHKNAELIREFYEKFKAGDVAGMTALYHHDAVFSDPIFPSLTGDRISGMWKMIVENSKDARVTAHDFEADDRTGKARWEAEYTFKNGRRVHNVVCATFEFRDGKIVKHEDSYDLHRWASMALGMKGKLLGWLPPVQASVRKTAGRSLDAYLTKAAGHAERAGASGAV